MAQGLVKPGPSQTVASVRWDRAARVASTECSLLLTGETGTGKGYLARWIHDHSPRSGRPFVAVNCGAIPADVVDSHLFGHELGAFTDASRAHEGLVRAAEGGTLFLDEVGDLPALVQRRLLRLLEEREVQPVGAAAPQRVDVRVIAATGCSLPDRVTEGRFRMDLFYRLNVIHFELLPLRARRRDVPRLLDVCSRELAELHGRSPLRLLPETVERLERHEWPGNVRELRTVLERLYALCPDDTVTPDDLRAWGQFRLQVAPQRDRGSDRLRRLETVAMREALADSGGNVSRAATTLGVHRSTLHRWLARERLTA
ncbi:MAG: sigma-54-dependent Fis family transcriptional regulator [Phycisphaerales bacterium]|nr:sigma 54-interacting transcriptional regulator [Phycisphaerae bacterium]NNF41947.1 sigma-54-dependent Fis family transcriptional regulator [Phycisphaerales bacterium]NNM27370.1 sigma-54-dependent Fis family transcriptional regulator [Phycisphaerales bacterium]